MATNQDKHSFVLSVSLAELAFLLLFLTLLIAFTSLNALRNDKAELRTKVDTLEAHAAKRGGDAFDAIQEIEKLKLKMEALKKPADEFNRFLKTIAEDPSIPDDWEELVSGYGDMRDHEAERGEQLVEAKNIGEDRLAQVKNLLKRGNGLDHPPCWADPSTGVNQYLFLVTVNEESVDVTAKWPSSRRDEVDASEHIHGALGVKLTREQFRKRMAPIKSWSKRQDPECRHFVIIRNNADSKEASIRSRWMIEDYFYKYEVRR